MEVGVVGYGAYLPRYRLKTEEIARIWGADPKQMKRGLGVEEKAVAGPDEDTVTISVEAAKNALRRGGIDPSLVGAIYVGSESHPYAVKPTASIVAEAVGAVPEMTAADLEFACKAGTAGVQACMGMVEAGMIRYGLAIGADTAQSSPGDPLEYAAAAGGAALLIGKLDEEAVAAIEATYSYTTDTPDFWRRDMHPYPRHGGRFTGRPGYFKHTLSAAQGLLRRLGLTPRDFDHAVFHQPNGRFPVEVARELGFSLSQIRTGLLSPKIGNTYSGATLLGLAAIFDRAKEGERILAVSYGSGAGSDAFSFIVKEGIERKRELAPKVSDYLENKVYIDYATYCKFTRKLVR
ncbi:MAG: hydroxymethylglutaryl-CoA synthase [Hadesarchaea archaeon]|jgi:hydroxymethylglutaryl-CoA synthase|nr:hydroxymethylglutaryl-CoA synthase [Hadesarchaea archaeon]